MASVTTILYAPPAKPEIVNGSVCAVPFPAPDQVYGPVPPVTSIVTDPFAAPQVAAEGTAEAVMPLDCGTVALTVVEQPLASVITILYVPPAKPLIVNCVVCEVPLVAPVQEYGAVPPVITTVIEPFAVPQAVGVVVAVAENCPGAPTLADVVFVQPLESVTVTVYVPARRPPKSCVVSPLDQRYWYCGVPPVTLRLMVPLAPAQPAGDTSVVRFKSGGSVTTRNRVAVQKVVRSVTTTVYILAERLLISCVVAKKPEAVQTYWKLPEPPDTVRLIAPFEPPGQLIGVTVADRLSGCMLGSTVDFTAIHPFASITVTVYDPGGTSFRLEEVEPFDHWKVYGAVPPDATAAILASEL